MLKTFLLVILLAPAVCFAQISVSGRVLNNADHKPVANASVFISNGTIGDKTNNDGTFILNNLKPGKYNLVVSIIGFETYSEAILISDADNKLPDILLSQKTMQLNEVTVKPISEKNRALYFAWLKEEFLGQSDMAKQCKILNPEMLDFSFQNDTLKASSIDFLIIENKALGYKLKYLLSDFTLSHPLTIRKKMSYQGFVLFEEMKGTPDEKKAWQKARLKAYANSSMHFLRSVIDNRVSEEGFRMQQVSETPNPARPANSLIAAKIKYFTEIKPATIATRDSLDSWIRKSLLPKTLLQLHDFALNTAEVLKNTEQKGLYVIGCDNDIILVNYNKSRTFGKVHLEDIGAPYNSNLSLLEFNRSYALFNNGGRIINSNDVMLAGVWANERVANLLPEDYEDNPGLKAEKADSALTNIATKIETFSTDHITEKSHLHLVKYNYLPGDTVWFKAYVVSGPTHTLSSLSGVLHVDLISPKDSLVRKINLQVNDGIAVGDFALSRSLNSGLYRIRAYTNWMRNDNNHGIYEQQIQVGPQVLNYLTAKQEATKNISIQFFPEGGDLINGLRSKVAIKAINSNGLGENVTGSITDNDGAEVAEFETQHLGMGAFALTPQAGKTYKAIVKIQSGQTFTADLPNTNQDGFVLTVNNRKADSISIKITAADNTFASKKNSGYYLVAQSAGAVYYTTSFKLENPTYNVNIDKQRFPSGIVQFTLFAQNAEPLNERIAFIKTNDTLKINIKASGKTFGSKQKMDLSLGILNNSGAKVQGSFSASVINESIVGNDENVENTILSNLLLTSDLKGYIEKPNYYFTNITDQTESDLDLLMLTQGYRHFEWKQILADKPAPFTYNVEKSLELNGALQTPGGKPLPNGKVTLFANRENFYADTIADLNGDFKFTGINISDTSHVLIQARKQNDGKNVSIFIKQPDYPKIEKLNSRKFDTYNLNTEKLVELQQDYAQKVKQQDSIKNGIALKEVLIKGKKAVAPNDFNRNGTNQQVNVNMAKLRTFKDASLKDALYSTEPRAHIDIGAGYKNDILNGNKAMLVDGVIVDEQQLAFYRVDEIESVQLVFGTGGIKPSFVLTTKRHAGTDTTVLKEVKIRSTKTNKLTYKGYSADKPGLQPQQVIMGDKLTGCITLSDCLRSKVFGVMFDAKGNPTDSRDKRKMAIILNGAVLDGSALSNISAMDVYSVEVLRGGSYAALIGPEFPGGALAITTKKGESSYLTGSSSSSGVITYPFKGFYKARTFYSPKYTASNINPNIPDYRTTIFWEPNIVTNAEGEASFRYFNADTRGIYRVTIEGIDANGNLGRQVYRYKVE